MYQLLEANDLVKTYNRKNVVNKVSIKVSQGEIVGLLGPNGAGKTTIFYMIVGLIRPDNGVVMLNKKDLTHLPMYLRAREGIGYLPQEASVFRKLTVEENVTAILQTLSYTKDEIKKKTKSLLEELNIWSIKDSKGYSVSGGERRRVEITRSLATSPSFILLDEPFAGIDPIVVADIQKIIYKLKEKGIGILITDHNVRETLEVTDRAYIINEGVVLESGLPGEIANSEKAKQIYLGDKFSLSS
jgi:lipopolysaccharide export system ATP-binding protein